MKLSEFVEKNLTHITLEKTYYKNGTSITVPDLCLELCFGLLSTNNKEEYTKLCIHLSPVGTIIDEIPSEFYEGKILLLRNWLTQNLLKDRNFAKFITILERRDSSHWAKQDNKTIKTAEIKKGEEIIKFSFEGI